MNIHLVPTTRLLEVQCHDMMSSHFCITLGQPVCREMFKAGNFSFSPEIHNDGAPTYDNPDTNNLPCNNPYHTRDNSHEVDSLQHSEPPSIPSPNLSLVLPLLPSSSETSASPHQATPSTSNTQPPFFSSTGFQNFNDNSNHVLSESSSQCHPSLMGHRL